MRIKGVHEEDVKRFLEENYNLEIKKIKYFPLGEDGASYTVWAKEGKYFAKVYENGKDAFKSNREIKTVIEFLYELSNLYDIENVPLPKLNKNKTPLSRLDGRPIVLYDFIPGNKPSEEDLTKHYKELSSLFSKIHNIPTKNFPRIKKENLSLKWEKEILKILNKLKKEEYKSSSHKRKLKEIILKDKDMLEKSFAFLLKESKKVTSQEKNYVITHADLHRSNMILTKEKLYVIDWDGLELAQKEKDLIWFMRNDKLDKKFVELYESGLKKGKINKEFLKFYRIRRFTADIVFFSKKILERDITKDEFNGAIEIIKNHLNSLKAWI